MVAFGLLTPGGGFQGGVILAAGLVLVWAAGSYRAFEGVSPTPLVDLAEGTGAGVYPALGLVTLIAGGAFLENLLPLGTVGSPIGGGTIPVLNLATALAVSAAIVLLISEFLQELAVPIEQAQE